MIKINLRGISEILSEKELKNVMGGSGPEMCLNWCKSDSDCCCGCTCNEIPNWPGRFCDMSN